MGLKHQLLASVLGMCLVVAGHASADTLGDALAAALATNPQLNVQEFQTQLAEESLRQARAQGRTSVNVGGSAGYEYNDTNAAFSFNTGERPLVSAQIQAVKPIYTGGRVSAGVRQAKAGIDAADADLSAARQDLFLQVVTAYVDVRRDREAVDIRENNVAVTGEQVRAASDRFDVGVVTRTDVALSEARLEGARAALAGAEAAEEASVAQYVLLTGLIPVDLSPPPPLPPLPANLEDAIALSLDNNPDIASARFSERAANEAIEVARSQLRPQISIVGTAGAQESFGTDSRRDTNVSAVAQGSIPLFSGGLINSQIRAAKLQRRQARARIDILERQARAQVAASWFGFKAAERSIEASERQVEAAEIAYDGAKEELAVGVRTTLDVLDQEQQLFEARLAVIQAERDAYVAAHQLLRAMGALDYVPETVAGADLPALTE